VRGRGFAHRNVFGASIARWPLIIAAGSAATACSHARLGNNAADGPLVELALGQATAALADAPGTDEAGLRQTLAIYWAPLRAKASAIGASAGAPAASGGGDESALPHVHLAVAPPTAAAATTTAAIKPIAGLTPAVSP
jgi:hypothetical protein